MVKDMAGLAPSTRLLTLLNVQSAKPSQKRTRDWHALARKAQKHQPGTSARTDRARQGLGDKLELAASLLDGQDSVQPRADEGNGDEEEHAAREAAGDSDDEDEPALDTADSFTRHFGPESPLVKGKDKAVCEEEHDGKLKKTKAVLPGVGEAQVLRPETVSDDEGKVKPADEAFRVYNPKLLDKMRSSSSRTSIPPTQSAWLRTLSTYQDVLCPRVVIGSDEHDAIREASALHAMNHVYKTRTRILKNNDFLAKQAADKSGASSSASTRNTLDQSFTRPKVLLLTPFRNSALAWAQHLISYLPPSITSVENFPRFVSEYSLPEGAEDKLVANADNYPADHVATFAGNIDDSFRCGIKVTRKSAKMFAEFYQADVILASPLGLRTSIEKDGDSDFLSSIEVFIVDQMDVMLMQNWDHVQFIFDRLNALPATDHGIDFSRVKPWYLDSLSPFLRQSILLSSFDAPELRSAFSRACRNRAGRVRALGLAEGEEGVLDRVPRGVRQVWSRFEVGDVQDEDDRRFEWFTTKTLPTLLKSAVSSSQTILFVPSYFDFLRLKRYLTKHLSSLGSDFSFAAISEYTPTPDISRARGAFFAGKKKFLLVTERFHFFRRYRLRGAKTVVFYAPPSHASYYPEVLSFPFSSTDGADVDVDEGELSAHVVFSRLDVMKLERIVGRKDARRMCGAEGEKRFTFV